MNDEQILRTVGSWLKDADVPAPDAPQSTRQVTTRLAGIHQRGRRWQRPTLGRLGRTTGPLLGLLRRRPRPKPSPAANGYEATTLRRFETMFSATRFVVAATFVTVLGGLLLTAVVVPRPGSPGPSAGQSAAPSLTWAPIELPGRDAWLLDTGDTFVATDADGRQHLSGDGLDWRESDHSGTIIDAYGGSLLIQNDGGPLITVRHPDGTESSQDLPDLEWMGSQGSDPFQFSETAFGPAGIVLVACDTDCLTSTVWYSKDGEAWQMVYRSARELWEVVMATADGFMVRSDRGGDFTVLFSTDGVGWTRLNATGYDRYALIGSTPWGGIARMPISLVNGHSSAGALMLAGADGLRDLALPTDIAPHLADRSRWSMGAGPLGFVAIDIPDGRALFSPDGHSWAFEPLPYEVPLTEDPDGRPDVHVGPGAILLGSGDMTGRQMMSHTDWWRATPG